MSQIRVNNITNKTGIAGPTVAGIASVNSNSHFVVPTGRTGQRYADDGENIVRDGLVLYLDAKYSYPSKTGIGTTTSGAAAPAGSSTDVDVYTWYDMSGNENHGQLVNGVGYNAANGGSLVFDGVNDYVSGSIPTLSTWSMCLWYLSADIISQTVFYPFSGTANDNGLGFGGGGVDFANRWYFYDGTSALSNSNTAVTTNVWYNLVVTKTSTTYNLYTNGSLSLNTTGRDISLTQYNLGRRGDDYWYVKGKISQASIYNRALTAQEVLQNYNATKSRFGL